MMPQPLDDQSIKLAAPSDSGPHTTTYDISSAPARNIPSKTAQTHAHIVCQPPQVFTEATSCNRLDKKSGCSECFSQGGVSHPHPLSLAPQKIDRCGGKLPFGSPYQGGGTTCNRGYGSSGNPALASPTSPAHGVPALWTGKKVNNILDRSRCSRHSREPTHPLGK
jgi:hypothetical protein